MSLLKTLFGRFFFVSDSEPLTIKKVFLILFLKLYEFIFKPRLHFHDFDDDDDLVKAGTFPSPVEWKLECPRNCDLYREEDEVMIYGVNSKKECLLVRVARIDDRMAEAWLYLRLTNGKVYVLQETGRTTDDRYFQAAGLRLQCLSPLRIWRIFFNGLLRENDGRVIHVKFSFVWTVLSDVYDFTSDVDKDAMANALDHASFFSLFGNVSRARELMDVYTQHGQMRGTIKLEGSDKEKELHLWGTKMRNLRKISSEKQFCHVFAYLQHGILLHIGIESVDNVIKRLHHGHIMNSNGRLHSIKCKILPDSENMNEIQNKVLEFSLEDETYNLKFTSEIYSTLFMKSKWPNGIELKHVTMSKNGKKGHGIVLKGKILKNKRKYYPVQKPINKTENLLVVPLTSLHCQVSELTGGKGSSLGILTEIAADNKNFIVPKGVVVTTKAYKIFQDTNRMKDIVSSLQKITRITKSDVKDECQRIMKEVAEIPLSNIICDEIEKNLKAIYTSDLNNVRFSVRSSTCGEDSEDMSAAGQMETYLGISGLKNILTAVKKCWASQFSFTDIEYKRQNGQLLNLPMAVVIQEMVNADVAGVMFTCNPVTSNPKHVTITANYGLGESVVAAKAEPDTIYLERDINQKLTLNNITIGKKDTRVVVSETGDVVEEKNIEFEDKCCLTDEQVLYLGNVGIMLEKEFGSCRDIEWCFSKDQLYLLQSRPITSITTETDYEIAHEFDAIFRDEEEYLSTGNVGEVLPGAMSPLCVSLCQKTFSHNFMKSKWRTIFAMNGPSCPYFPMGIHYFNGHALFNVIDGWLNYSADKGSTSNKVLMLASIGRIIDDDELYERAKERFSLYKKKPLYKRMRPLLFFIKNFITAEGALEERRKKYFNYKIKDLENFKTSLELYQAIPRHWKCIFPSMDSNTEVSLCSAMYNTNLMSLLVKEYGGWNNDVYADFANLLSNCSNVESADVPQSLEALARTISNEIQPTTFKAMKTEDALKWLQTSSSKSAEDFKNFLNSHGHRSIKEFDPYSIPWRKNQYKLVQTLQDLVNNIKNIKSSVHGNVLDKLKKYPSWKSRLLFKFLLPRCQQAVRLRERGKSFMIKMFDAHREAYWHLAELMVLEGRLPHRDLLFFLSYDEIGELIRTRSSKLISKAIRRKKIYAEQDKIIYPEVMRGIPQPINLGSSNITYKSEAIIKGIPVSCGMVKGPARVILNVEEAVDIRSGEILITYSTDIGWSPYFPLLAGVVTEIGGLISHGAVVAREYGLPGVVAAHGAINLFKTGDIVVLNGDEGTICKVKESDVVNGGEHL
ncbi:uncharacterized protein LOC111613200 [Centruroides sculpturatus]|uniref:uncharacterized protein LOC111613200 n=1 Tax=Centruroides sculpturatus TaxID=218467 RepID=UPI000C6EB429|nr:uncharacterized protein LOC111613200 [Centruroides sculpturatus]